MNKWKASVGQILNNEGLRLFWVLMVILSLVLGSGAPTAFGGGSGGGG